MKKFIILIAVFMLLSGCGGKESTGADVSLTEAPLTTDSSAPTPPAPKTQLTIAGFGMFPDIYSLADEFNRNNEEFEITVKEYSIGPDGSSDVAIDSFYFDVAKGDLPDMFIMSGAPFQLLDTMISKGMMIDLYPFLDGDGELGRDDFFGSLLKAVEQDNTLYYMPTSFLLRGIVGIPEYANLTHFSLEAIRDIRAENPDKPCLFGMLYWVSLIELELSQNPDQYVNFKTGECFFTSERFIELLETANCVTKEIPDELVRESARGTLIAENEQHFDFYQINNLGIYTHYIDRYGGNAAFLPLSESEAVFYFNTDYFIAISSTCADTDGAWSFLRSFLLPDYQDTLMQSLPVNISSFEHVAREYIEVGVGGDADTEGLRRLINNTTATRVHNTSILPIIYEEAAAFIAGDKEAEQVAGIIQSRVSIYLAEGA